MDCICHYEKWFIGLDSEGLRKSSMLTPRGTVVGIETRCLEGGAKLAPRRCFF